VTTDGFGLVIGFLELVQLIPTSKKYSLTLLHTSQITRLSQSAVVLTNRCFVSAPLPLGSQTVPGLSYQILTATAHSD
jgi:hypothetical protein